MNIKTQLTNFITVTLPKARLACMAACLCLISTVPGGCSKGHDQEARQDGQHEEATKEDHDHEEGMIVFTDKQAGGAVEVEGVSYGPLPGVITCSARISGAQSQTRTVTAPLAGEVTFYDPALTSGTAVGAGQHLFNISARNIVQSDPTASLRADLANAQANLKRVKEQFDDRLVTKAEYDAALAAVNSARAALNNPGAAPRKSGSASSPISGFISELLVKPGDYVETGTPLATVSTSRRLQLIADVPQGYAAQLPQVTGANIILPYSGPESANTISLSGLNSKIISYGKSSTDGLYVPMAIEFDNPGTLTAGQTVEARLLTTGNADNASCLSVPRSALTEEEGLYFVYVQESPEHYRKQQVSRGRDNGAIVEITSGLKDGDLVVIRGATLLKLAANSGKAPQGHSHNH